LKFFSPAGAVPLPAPRAQPVHARRGRGGPLHVRAGAGGGLPGPLARVCGPVGYPDAARADGPRFEILNRIRRRKTRIAELKKNFKWSLKGGHLTEIALAI